MEITALCSHLRHPFTYTDAKGKTQQLSSTEISQVALFVLSTLAMAIFAAIKSNRSLKSSSVSIGILACAAFYLATALMKMGCRGDGSGRGKGPLKKEPHMLEVSGMLGQSEWVVVDDVLSSSNIPVTTVSKKKAPKTFEKSFQVSQESSTIHVSADGWQDKSGWAFIDNQSESSASKLQETSIATVTSEVKKEEAPTINVPVTNITQTLESSEKLPVGQDEMLMQISVIGSPVKSEWVYIDNSLNASGLELQVTTKEEKKGPDLTVSVFGSELNEWVSMPGLSNCCQSYNQLIVTNDQIKVISEMLQLIGDTLLPLLYFKKSKLLEMGEKIKDVHPLKFLETILNTPKIKKSMLAIKGSGLKWNGFLNGDNESPGFIDKCEREFGLEIFEPYIIDFCLAVKVDSQTVLSLFEAKRWEELISFLIQ
jgi:hypothetical protein